MSGTKDTPRTNTVEVNVVRFLILILVSVGMALGVSLMTSLGSQSPLWYGLGCACAVLTMSFGISLAQFGPPALFRGRWNSLCDSARELQGMVDKGRCAGHCDEKDPCQACAAKAAIKKLNDNATELLENVRWSRGLPVSRHQHKINKLIAEVTELKSKLRRYET